MAKLIEPEDGNDTSREQWILAKILHSAVISVDSIFCGNEYTEEQIKETLLKAKVTEDQVENLMSVLHIWLEMFKNKEVEGWYDHGE